MAQRRRPAAPSYGRGTEYVRSNHTAARGVAAKRANRSRMGWLKAELRKRPLPLWTVIVADVLVIGIALLVFAYFHHVRPRAQEAVGIASSRESMVAEISATAAPAQPQQMDALQQNLQAAIEQAQAVAQAQSEPVGYFGTKFADKFTNGEVIQDQWSYKSANLNVSIRQEKEYSSDIFICDIYVKDIECFRTAFAYEKFGRGINEELSGMAARVGSIACVNGDYYGLREEGAIIRNGVLYRDDDYSECDICVLYWDGTMKTFPAGAFDAEKEIAAGAYQSWAFGPMLLDETGEPLSEFNCNEGILGLDPRTAIGYFEPGHYCLVVIDGRTEASHGVTMEVLGRYMYLLGCKQAYNLDGGKTSQMLWGTQTVNNPNAGGRDCSDIVYVGEL